MTQPMLSRKTFRRVIETHIAGATLSPAPLKPHRRRNNSRRAAYVWLAMALVGLFILMGA